MSNSNLTHTASTGNQKLGLLVVGLEYLILMELNI